MPDSNDQRFRGIIATVLGIEPAKVQDQLNPDSVDTWDSLNHINLIAALEQEFGIMLPAGSLAANQSVRGLRTMLVEHGVEI
jgi:acyl carrier protein